MKVKRMSNDQCKASIEPRPLQVLYTKYSSSEANSPCLVRPLGKSHNENRPSSEKPPKKNIETSHDKHITYKRNRHNLRMARKNLDRAGLKFTSESNLSSIERENTAFPLLNLSRSQTFENKFKIAASRSNGSQDLSPKSNKTVEKKVVHLPLFRINLKTYTGDTEVSDTVAKTRESLRKLMELHANRMRNNVTTANIRNYEFNAPKSNSCDRPNKTPDLLAKLNQEKTRQKQKGGHSLPDGPKPTLSRQPSRLSALDLGAGMKTPTYWSHRETPNLCVRPVYSSASLQADEPDDSMLSVAMRPDTSFTIGSTIHQTDRAIKSPGSDEMRELNEMLRITDSQQAWPPLDELHRYSASLRSQSRNRRSRTSRPGTVLHDLIETPDDTYHNHQYMDSFYGPRPHKFRYTPRSTYKLDPIVVPSHTNVECAMCNIYQREMESPGPPNTPNTGQFMIDRDSPRYSPGNRQYSRAARLLQRPDISLHLPRMNSSATGFREGEESATFDLNQCVQSAR